MAFTEPVPEVDEVGSPEGEITETPSKQRTRLFAGEVAAAVTPLAELRPEEYPTTARTRYRSQPSSSQRTPDQLPDDDETPCSKSIHRRSSRLATAVPTTPHQNQTAPSTPKRTPGPPTRGKSISRRNAEVGAGDRLALPLGILG